MKKTRKMWWEIDPTKAEERELKRRKRAELYHSWALKGMNLNQIGKKEGITHERVRQILNLYKDTYYVPKPRIVPTVFTCEACKVEFSKPQTFGRQYRYCSRACSMESRRGKGLHANHTPEEKREYLNQRAKIYYHDVLKKLPDVKERFRKYNNHYLQNLTPEQKERNEKKRRERYFKMKSDPVKYQEHLAYCRKMQRKDYVEKKKARGG